MNLWFFFKTHGQSAIHNLLSFSLLCVLMPWGGLHSIYGENTVKIFFLLLLNWSVQMKMKTMVKPLAKVKEFLMLYIFIS